jgi:hypothetical protein
LRHPSHDSAGPGVWVHRPVAPVLSLFKRRACLSVRSLRSLRGALRSLWLLTTSPPGPERGSSLDAPVLECHQCPHRTSMHAGALNSSRSRSFIPGLQTEASTIQVEPSSPAGAPTRTRSCKIGPSRVLITVNMTPGTNLILKRIQPRGR